jgi:hypothetical protein
MFCLPYCFLKVIKLKIQRNVILPGVYMGVQLVSLMLRDEMMLSKFANGLLRKMLRLKREKVTEACRNSVTRSFIIVALLNVIWVITK